MGLVSPGQTTPWCGGSLLTAQHVVTAASCTYGRSVSTIEVMVGEHNTTDSIGDRHSISAITDHPGFNKSTREFDISILTLDSPIIFSSVAAPICLPASVSSLYTGQVATVTGWGGTTYQGAQATTLHQANVTVLSNANCIDRYESHQIQK